MKAMLMKEFGGPDALSYEEIDTPAVGPDDVLVEVHAVSINRTFDIYLRENTYAYTPDLPHILGVDPSGVIVEVGEKVTDRKVGDRVFCSLFVPTTRSNPYMAIPGLGPVDFLGVTTVSYTHLTLPTPPYV